MLILIVAGGPDKGRTYEFADSSEVVLGRAGADVCLNDASVSPRHAKLFADAGRWYIRDLQSEHGTARNRVKISRLQPLSDGDHLQVGRSVLVLARGDGSRDGAASAGGKAGRGTAGRPWQARTLWIGGSLAAAAALLVGLNIASILLSSSGVSRIVEGLAGDRKRSHDAQRRLQHDLQLAVQAKQEHEQRVERMLAAFAPVGGELMPKVDAILATLESQPDVLGPLTTLAEAIEQRDTGDAALDQKIDTALALLHENGGAAQRLAGQFREALDGRPTAEQLAQVARRDARQAKRLDAALSRLEEAQPHAELTRINARLAELSRELRASRDNTLMHDQLAVLIEAEDARAAAATAADPMLGQILTHVESMARRQTKLDAVYASLQKAPYRNRAMLDEVLAQVQDDTSTQVVAAMLDEAMAELRGKSITDADELRRLIRRNVTAALGPAGPRDPSAEQGLTRLTQTERAYKLAFENDQKVVIGRDVINPATGRRAQGRMLDPAVAKAKGYTSWRDWYLMDDFAQRTSLQEQAARFAERDEPRINALKVPALDALEGHED